MKNGRRAISIVKYGLEEIADSLIRPDYASKIAIFKFSSCLTLGQSLLIFWLYFSALIGTNGKAAPSSIEEIPLKY